jgi:hypothetical protein
MLAEGIVMKNTYIFSGHAQLPEGTDIYETYKSVSVVAEIDMVSGKIVNCSVPVYFKGNSDFVAAIMCGKSIDTDLEVIISEIDERFHTLSKRALITAIQAVYNRYCIAKKSSVAKKGIR